MTFNVNGMKLSFDPNGVAPRARRSAGMKPRKDSLEGLREMTGIYSKWIPSNG